MRRAPFAFTSLAVVAALALSGCASDGSDDAASNESGQEWLAGGGGAGDNKSGIATGQDGFQNVRDLTSQLGTDAEPGKFPRTITNITANETVGETEIPASPSRSSPSTPVSSTTCSRSASSRSPTRTPTR